MPRLSCWFIKAALLYLLAGVTFGALILVNKAFFIYPVVWQLLTPHIEFLLFGWTVQLILGVVFWIFPRFVRSRGNTKPAWVAFVLLNIGVWLVGFGNLINSSALLPLVGRLAEFGAVIAFALHIWPRIKPFSTTHHPKSLKK